MIVGRMHLGNLTNQLWHREREMFIHSCGSRTVSHLMEVVSIRAERNKRRCFII